MLERLRDLQGSKVGSLSMDEAVALSAFGRGLQGEYTRLGLPSPPWLGESLGVLGNEVRGRVRDALAKRVHDAKRRVEELLPADVKLSQAQTELSELEGLLEAASK